MSKHKTTSKIFFKPKRTILTLLSLAEKFTLYTSTSFQFQNKPLEPIRPGVLVLYLSSVCHSSPLVAAASLDSVSRVILSV